MSKNKNGNMYEWIDKTSNPLGGECIHNCSYCYVKKLKHAKPAIKNKYSGPPIVSENGMKQIAGKGKFIFVCDMTDLFAENVPFDNIKAIIDKCKSKPENKYLLQSKNTERMFDLRFLFCDIHNQIFSICTTFETNRHYPTIMGNSPKPMDRITWFHKLGFSGIGRYITIEPIMDFDLDVMISELKHTYPKQINIGADSGNNNLPEPSKEKLLKLITELEKFTTVKLKTNLYRLLK
jgi:DNA repair photolyase